MTQDKIKLHIDRKRMGDLVTLDQYLAMRNDDVDVMAEVLSLFVVGEDGAILPQDEGRKKLGKLTLNEYRLVHDAFWHGAEDAVVPPTNAAS
jgi:hypothetical protein